MDSKLAVGKSGKTFIVLGISSQCVYAFKHSSFTVWHLHVRAYGGGQRTAVCGGFSPSTFTWVPELNSHHQMCTARAFTYQTSPKVHLHYQLYNGKVSWILS